MKFPALPLLPALLLAACSQPDTTGAYTLTVVKVERHHDTWADGSCSAWEEITFRQKGGHTFTVTEDNPQHMGLHKEGEQVEAEPPLPWQAP